VAEPDPRVARWFQENRRPERPPDQIGRLSLVLPVVTALLAGLAAALLTAAHSPVVDEPSPFVQARVTAVSPPGPDRLCDVHVRDDEGDTGLLPGQSCAVVDSTRYVYLNPQGNLQATPPLRHKLGVIRDVLSGVLWFLIVLVLAGCASWLVWRSALRRRIESSR
jgi:hypothetical protein